MVLKRRATYDSNHKGRQRALAGAETRDAVAQTTATIERRPGTVPMLPGVGFRATLVDTPTFHGTGVVSAYVPREKKAHTHEPSPGDIEESH